MQTDGPIRDDAVDPCSSDWLQIEILSEAFNNPFMGHIVCGGKINAYTRTIWPTASGTSGSLDMT